MFRAAVERDPDGEIIRYFDGRLTLRELDELSDALAAALAAAGFAPGDRLAVYLQNVPQFVIAMVATWKAGGIIVSINPMNKERELATCSPTPAPPSWSAWRPSTAMSRPRSSRAPRCGP